MTNATPAFDQLHHNLDQALLVDRHRLRRQLHDLRKSAGTPGWDESKVTQWLERFQASVARVEARRRSVPVMRYDDALPIAAKRDEIKAALEKHQVLVIAGETRLGQDHPAAEDLSGDRSWRARPDRPHPAAPSGGAQRGDPCGRGDRHTAG